MIVRWGRTAALALALGGRTAALALALALSSCGGTSTPPQVQGRGTDAVVVEDFTVPAKDSDLPLFIRNKHPAEYYDFRPERTVLFLHGATFPGEATFDLQLDGTSWLDWMARRGYDVYVLDVRGYGKSGRPQSMARPAEEGAPAATTAEAMLDVAKAIDFITSRRNVPRVTLVGWSWGATLAGLYATQTVDKVERLVLYAPQWLRDGETPPDLGKLGAWRTVRLAQVREHWLKSIPESRRKDIVPAHWLNAWSEAMRASDPGAATDDTLRVPNGVVADALTTWARHLAPWQPEKVPVPTLVVQGEWDQDNPPAMGLAVFARLSKAPQRRYVLLGEATHSAMMERNREQLFRTVQGFLEERF
ncbi:MAG: alpha/beta hydrolase [Solirubrobacterales bacterium]